MFWVFFEKVKNFKKLTICKSDDSLNNLQRKKQNKTHPSLQFKIVTIQIVKST